ncbi:MAG: box helicase protein [Actinomycetota bacterium]|nr:box helicase protein [Actinomycetota bacterium]
MGRQAAWPHWVPAELVAALARVGVEAPWQHQVAAAEHAHAGRSVVVATGTASGKSLAYVLPAVTAVLDHRHASQAGPFSAPRPTTLYISPTKALAADQLRSLTALDIDDLRPATFDGDTPTESRDWVRHHASYVLTNPDMLHRSILPGHARWAAYLRGLQYVVIDECHRYRGVFGSHVSAVLRRLRRVCAHYGSNPTFVLASATVSNPATSASRLVGLEVTAVDDDASPRGETLFALWEPPLTELTGENDAPVRRTATAEVADLMADLVSEGARTVSFVRSRRAAETVSLATRRLLDEVDPELGRRVAAYRAGYLPEERRALEADLQSGRILGVASTNALELGVDIAGLDAVLLAGYPGTRASLWQQAGRAGRAGQGALAVLVARDDPLDTYLTHHPEMIFGSPVEATVLDPDNPHVLQPHLCAAASELPLTEDDLPLFGPTAPAVVERLETAGLLRRRATGWFWTRPERASDLADIRGTGGSPVELVEDGTGRVLGMVDAGSAHATAHAGAVYLHQGETYLVDSLDLEHHVALLHQADPDWTTFARDVTDIRILETETARSWADTTLSFGAVEVTSQVVAFLRKRVATGEVLGEEPLDLPPRQLRTRAVWWTVTAEGLARAELAPAEVPGAAHAAEHASIGLLPLFATCDRWDIGGVSTAHHLDTGEMTVFVYDGYPGGAGFAERAHDTALAWLTATREAIASCECQDGCPSCVQSPKCGNGNDPLDKAGAVRLLDVFLAQAPRPDAVGASGPETADEVAPAPTPFPVPTRVPSPAPAGPAADNTRSSRRGTPAGSSPHGTSARPPVPFGPERAGW